MLELKKDTHLLFYNVFGGAVVTADKVTVSINIFKNGRIQGRTLIHELESPLPNVAVPILLYFGAWVEPGDIHFTPGKLDGYDAEAYMINKETIDRIINSALATVKGAVLK